MKTVSLALAALLVATTANAANNGHLLAPLAAEIGKVAEESALNGANVATAPAYKVKPGHENCSLELFLLQDEGLKFKGEYLCRKNGKDILVQLEGSLTLFKTDQIEDDECSAATHKAYAGRVNETIGACNFGGRTYLYNFMAWW